MILGPSVDTSSFETSLNATKAILAKLDAITTKVAPAPEEVFTEETTVREMDAETTEFTEDQTDSQKEGNFAKLMSKIAALFDEQGDVPGNEEAVVTEEDAPELQEEDTLAEGAEEDQPDWRREEDVNAASFVSEQEEMTTTGEECLATKEDTLELQEENSLTDEYDANTAAFADEQESDDHGPIEKGLEAVVVRASSQLAKYQCGYCKKLCKTSTILGVHVRSWHTNERPFTCDDCDKTFNNLDVVKEHSRIHIGAHLSQCAACGKKFNKMSSFIEHQWIHQNENPWNLLLGPIRCRYGYRSPRWVRFRGTKRGWPK